MKNRIAIFAHYDKDNIIDDYVVAYLTELKKFCDKIIFVSDGNILMKEFKKIDYLCTSMTTGKHGKYDFGSWKSGFSTAQRHHYLSDAEEIVFVNDSCCLIDSLAPTFNQMESKDLDFWGLAESIQGKHHHVHSYFFALRKAAFSSNEFQTFLNSVKQEKNKKDIIKNYEFGLSKVMVEAGFKMGSLFGIMNCGDISKEATIKDLIKRGFPLIKINVFQRGFVNLLNFKKFIKPAIYDVFKSNVIRRIGDEKLLLSYKISSSYKRFFIAKLFCVLIKNYFLKVKFLGITILKIDLKK